MPVKDRNPFGSSPDEQPSKADVGAPDPFDAGQGVVVCPVCKERRPEKIGTRNTPSQILRNCTTCGNQWSCGTVGGAYMVPITEDMRRPPAPEEEDIAEDFRLSGTERWFDD